ncbi:MAG: hypothetical protein U1D31_03005 [Patescibacteria group bacterium]|nr:hypothetical protein [bacterium]MDZ4241062.1 hypothetical protein [Patescibacteria group bacterium]
MPQKVQAAVPTFDVGLNPAFAAYTAAFTTYAGIETANTTSLTVKETILDAIAWAAAKVIIQNMLQSIVTWAQNGFNGGPSFIQDPEGFLRDVGDQTAGLVISDIAPFLCEPFRISLQTNLSLSYSLPVFDKIECTLSDVIDNIDGFLNGDFTQGGWDGWFSMTQNKRNNPYGAFLLAQSELNVQVAKKQGTELKFLDWGQGFFSFRDADGLVQTPGKIIENQLNHSLGSGTRSLEIADEIDEVIGAVVAGLVTQMFSGGSGFLGL